MSIAFHSNSIYTVQPGDTIYSIAMYIQSNVVEEIAQMNHLFPPVSEPYLIFPGQKLVIPVYVPITTTFYIIAPGDSLHLIAERYSTTVEELIKYNSFIEDPNLIFPGQQLLIPALIYIVEPSDSIHKIATRFGVDRSEIIRANQDRPGFSPDMIWPGYALIIPHS